MARARRIIKRLLLIVAIIVVVVAAASFAFVYRSGEFRELNAHFDGQCEALGLPGSAEDIQIDRERGLAYLSVVDRRAVVEGKPVQGMIYVLDLNASTPTPRPAIPTPPAHFRPHGLSLFIAGNGQRYLLAINHPAAEDELEAVEIFAESAPGVLKHSETIADVSMLSPNNLVAVGPRQFYVANNSGATNRFDRMTEMLFWRGISTLVYFDGEQARVAADDLASANGVVVSNDGSLLYVAETLGSAIRVYRRNGFALEELNRFSVETSPDNLDLAADGSLWLAGHPKTLALIKHFVDAANPAPSQVFRIRNPNDPKPVIDEIYMNGRGDFCRQRRRAVW